MPELDGDGHKRRRRRTRPVPERQRCDREGCTRRKASGQQFCSMLCRAVHVATERTERLCTELGPGTAEATHLWLLAVDLNETATALHAQTHRSVRRHGLVRGAASE